MDEHRFRRPGVARGPGRRLRVLLVAVVLVPLLPACDVWEQLGHGPGNGRFNPGEAAITPATAGSLSEAWSVHVDGSFSEPILSGGRVYTTVVSAGTASVRAYRADTGALVWSRAVPAPANPGEPGPVAMAGGDLWVSYAGRGASICSALLTRLDPVTGDLVATETTGPAVLGPVVSEGTTVAYVTRGCTATGSQPQLVVRDTGTPAASWSHGFDLPIGGVPSPPSLGQGRIVVTAEDTVHAFDADGCGAATCAPVWTAALGLDDAPVRTDGRPVVGPDGTVYVGGEIPTMETLVQALDGATGALRWRTDLHEGPGVSWQSLALAHDRLYVADHRYAGGSGGAVEVFAAAGCGEPVCAPVWSAAVDGPPVAGLTVGGDVLHLGVFDWTDSRFVAFDARGCGAAVCPALGNVGFGDEQPLRAAVAGGRVAVVGSGPTGETLRVLVPST